MPQPFLTPPEGETQLRAPRIDEGSDVLGNIAGNDPNIVGKLAQWLLKLREPLATASMGMGPSTAVMPPWAREAAHFQGLRPSMATRTPSMAQLRDYVSPEAISARVVPLLEAAKPVPATTPYVPRTSDEELWKQLLTRNTQLQELVASLSKPPTTELPIANPPPSGLSSRQQQLRLRREGAPIDAEAAKLTPEEIQEILKILPRTGQHYPGGADTSQVPPPKKKRRPGDK